MCYSYRDRRAEEEARRIMREKEGRKRREDRTKKDEKERASERERDLVRA